MITDDDILSGIREAGHGDPAWMSAELDGPCPPTQAILAGLKAHFGVAFGERELEAVPTVRALVDLLRRKFDEE